MAKKPLAVIAGVGPGIGDAVARRFAKEGMHVVLLARNGVATGATAASISAEGGSASVYQVDLTESGDVRKVFRAIRDAHGPCSLLVYNAATWHEAPSMEISVDQFMKDLELCTGSLLACCQAVYPDMKDARRGSILITGGGLALNPSWGAGLLSLTAGKAAGRAMAHALAKELEPDGIQVATVTVAGMVGSGTAFDPGHIAEEFLKLWKNPRPAVEVETIFKGKHA